MADEDFNREIVGDIVIEKVKISRATVKEAQTFRDRLFSDSISGYNKGTFTAKGYFVATLHFWICSRKISGYILPEPITPKQPELLTAAANFQPLHQIIPAWISG